MKKLYIRWSKLLKSLGPGIVSGAADDDPSGIATYSQTGAQFGYGQLWVSLYILPFMTAVQAACARIGAVTGKGLAANIRAHYSKKVLYLVVTLIVVANTINIGADLGAMTAAIQLIFPGNFTLITILVTGLILSLEIFTSYKKYAQFLKWLVLALVAYPVSVLLINHNWSEILNSTLMPHFEFSSSYLLMITGLIGTTISPYMFFWQTSAVVEEEKAHHFKKIRGLPVMTRKFLDGIKLDTIIGMLSSQVTSWSIMVVAGTVFFKNHMFAIETAAEAAMALEPLVQSFPNAGFLAKLIFAIGVVGLGLLAVPVLSGSAAYAVAETFGWTEGLNHKFKRALGFYGVICFSTLVGWLINLIGISPIKALIFTAVFNAVASIPLLFLIARLANNKKVVGKYRGGILSQSLLWLTFVGVTGMGIAMLLTVEVGGWSLVKLISLLNQ